MFGIPNPYVLMVAGGLGAGAIVGSFFMGVSYEHRTSRIDELKTELAVAKADATNARLAEVDAKEKQATLEAAATSDQEKINALEAQAAVDPGACRATGTDIDRVWGSSKR